MQQFFKLPVVFKILLPLIVGVVLHFYTGFFVSSTVLAVTLLVLVGLAIPRIAALRWTALPFGVILFGWFFMLGGFVSEINRSAGHPSYFATVNPAAEDFVLHVVEPPEMKENSVKCLVDVIKAGGTKSMGKALVYLQKDESSKAIVYGDLIQMRGKFNPIKKNGNPKEFDYQRYLKIHDIQSQTYIEREDWRRIGNDANPFYSWVYELRENFHSRLSNTEMSSKNAMVANALILGQKEYLDKEVLRSYSSAGAMHVLAVSGLHVGIIMLILNFVLAPLKRLKFGRTFFIVGVLSGIWFYALITGMSPSVMRAGVMFTFIVIGKQLERDTSVYQSILVSAFLLILCQPYIIFQVGFQLSYLAVLGIVFLQPRIVNLFYIKNKILDKAWQISAVSIAAQIATFPLGLYYFHQFPNFFLLSNLLVIPMAFLILLVGIFFLAFGKIPGLGELVIWVLDGLLTILNYGVQWVEKLPYSISWGYSIEWFEVFALYLTLFLGAIAFIKKRASFFIASLVGVVCLLGWNVYENEQLKFESSICFYNVKNEVAFDVFYGQTNHFYSSSELFENEEKLLFNVKHNWFYRTGAEQPTTYKDVENTEHLKVGEYTFLFVDNDRLDSWENYNYSAEYMVLTEFDFIPLSILEAWSQKEQKIILTGKVPYKTANFIREYEGAFQLIDLETSGAFELLL